MISVACSAHLIQILVHRYKLTSGQKKAALASSLSGNSSETVAVSVFCRS